MCHTNKVLQPVSNAKCIMVYMHSKDSTSQWNLHRLRDDKNAEKAS